MKFARSPDQVYSMLQSSVSMGHFWFSNSLYAPCCIT